MDINASVGMEYATPQLAEAFKLEHVFFSTMMEGYVNAAKQLLEMTMSFKLDAGQVMQERLSGLQIKVMNEIKKSYYDINVTALKLSYVVRNGCLQSQHIEMDLEVMTTGIAAKMKIIMDSTYSDYGVERLMVKPAIIPLIIQ